MARSILKRFLANPVRKAGLSLLGRLRMGSEVWVGGSSGCSREMGARNRPGRFGSLTGEAAVGCGCGAGTCLAPFRPGRDQAVEAPVNAGSRTPAQACRCMVMAASTVWVIQEPSLIRHGLLSRRFCLTSYLASFVSICTIAYGGLRHAAAHTAHSQAEAWRIIGAGVGGLVVALLAPTIVSIVRGLIPT